jgi:hypothetical protein
VFKLLNKGVLQGVYTLTGEKSNLSKKEMIAIIYKTNKPLFEEVFALTLGQKKPKNTVVQLMLNHGTPRDEDIRKLPQGKLDQVLEHDLGL